MSRLSGGPQQIVVRSTNNVYTALVAVAVVVEIVGLIVLWMQALALHGKALFAS